MKQAIGLSEDQLRATYDTYKTRGISSSPSVLIVMDKLQSAKSEKDFVIATAFGPGPAIEMSMFGRCHDNTDVTPEEMTGIRISALLKEAEDCCRKAEFYQYSAMDSLRAIPLRSLWMSTVCHNQTHCAC